MEFSPIFYGPQLIQLISASPALLRVALKRNFLMTDLDRWVIDLCVGKCLVQDIPRWFNHLGRLSLWRQTNFSLIDRFEHFSLSCRLPMRYLNDHVNRSLAVVAHIYRRFMYFDKVVLLLAWPAIEVLLGQQDYVLILDVQSFIVEIHVGGVLCSWLGCLGLAFFAGAVRWADLSFLCCELLWGLVLSGSDGHHGEIQMGVLLEVMALVVRAAAYDGLGVGHSLGYLAPFCDAMLCTVGASFWGVCRRAWKYCVVFWIVDCLAHFLVRQFFAFLL